MPLNKSSRAYLELCNVFLLVLGKVKQLGICVVHHKLLIHVRGSNGEMRINLRELTV